MLNGRRLLAGLAIASALSTAAYARIVVLPQESRAGVQEKYVMRIPNEKDSASITQIEVQFPAGLDVSSYEPKQGWKVDLKRDAKGKISAAVWSGILGPREFVEIGVLGTNPKIATNLVWKTIATYNDGTHEEYSNSRGSKLTAPVVTLRQPGMTSLHFGK